ncbi:MAG: YbaK/EbsC family protein [Nanoarchaeota archaeon]
MDYEEKLKTFLNDWKSTAEHLHFELPCHSVAEAAVAAKASPEDFIKSIVFVGSGKAVIVIVRGVHKADGKKVGAYVGSEVTMAKPEEVLSMTGYPIGGVPPVGYEARFLIDLEVMKCEVVIGGGGSDKALLKITTEEIKRLTNGEVVDVKR